MSKLGNISKKQLIFSLLCIGLLAFIAIVFTHHYISAHWLAA